jgi:beta-mannosidase
MSWGTALAFLLSWQLAAATAIDLSTLNWTLKNQNGSIVIPAYIPSQVHLDLLRAGIIDEPLLGTNG